MVQTHKFGIDLWNNVQALDIGQETVSEGAVPCLDNPEDEANEPNLVSWNPVNCNRTMGLITHLISHCMAIDVPGQR